jgi:hypothetical protein
VRAATRNCALACLLLLSSLSANADFLDWLGRQLNKPPVDYGYWSCSNCYIPSPTTPVDPTTGPADLQSFIKYNNTEIHDSKNETVHRWIPNSVITVCNAQNVCLTLKYAAASNLWLPEQPSFPLPPNKTPRVPRVPEVTQSPPPDAGQPGGTVGLWPQGMPTLSSNWFLAIPNTPITPPRMLTPSITVVQQDGTSTTYVFPPFVAEPLAPDVGNTFNWGPEASGLTFQSCASCHS